ncbi:MAG: hypothetical protein QOD03_1131 [Verrucomicrobiota bacterium]|jgi:hypothetical protein
MGPRKQTQFVWIILKSFLTAGLITLAFAVIEPNFIIIHSVNGTITKQFESGYLCVSILFISAVVIYCVWFWK